MRVLLLLALACPVGEGEDSRAWSAEHSQAEFEARFLGAFPARGWFSRLQGALRAVEDGRIVVEAEIALDSLQGLSERERRWVLGPDFFDAARHPRIRFRSEPLPCSALERPGPLLGRLEIRGIERPVRFELAPARCARAGIDCPLEARGAIRRLSFGLGQGAVGLGDRVALRLSIRFPDPERER